MRLHSILIIILLTLSKVYFGQDPSYFTLVNNELFGVDIYSIHQSKDGTIYLGTNAGLYRYQYDKFYLYNQNKKQKGNSFFQLQENQNGDIFCCNLNGQVFQVEQNQLDLYYETPAKHLFEYFNFFFDKDLLVYCSKGCYSVDTNKKVTTLSSEINVYNTQQLSGGKHGLFCSKQNTFNYYENEKIISIQSSFNKKNLSSFLLHTIENDTLYYNQKNGLYLNYIHFSDKKNENLICFDDSTFIGLDPKNGFTIYNLNKLTKEKYFDDQFISTFYKTEDNTIILGTFGKGLIIIPDINVKTIQLQNENARGIATNNKGVYITFKNGILSSIKNGKTSTDTIHKSRSLDWIFSSDISLGFHKPHNHLIFDSPEFNVYGTVKDFWQIDQSSGLIATSTSIIYVGNHNNRPSFEWRKTDSIYRLKEKGRFHSVAYDKTSKTLYFSKNQGCFQLNGNDTKQLFKEENYQIEDIEISDTTTIFASSNNGLIFQNPSSIKHLTTDNGLSSNQIKKITVKDSLLFILSHGGIQFYDLKNERLHYLSNFEGVTSNNIQDFSLKGDSLFLLDNNAITVLNYQKKKASLNNIKLNIDSVLLGSILLQPDTYNEVNYSQSKLLIYYHYNYLGLNNEIELQYRLIGLNNEWLKISNNTSSPIVFYSLPAGEYKLELKLTYRGIESEKVAYSFYINPPFWQKWWFYTLAGLIIFGITLVYFRRRIQKLNRINQEKIRQKTIEKNAIEYQLKALRSQMNPHFIFNALNSIQDLILREETEDSYDYIVLFSELVRNTLNYSNKEFIPIKNEIDFLNNYLTLEKLRFKKDFTYAIEYNGDEEVEIPSLIIQPFIENALLHGLLHKEGEKNLIIRFEYDEKLTCTITDNGIGRQKAKEIKQRRKQKHESFSLSAIKQRMEILQDQYSTEAKYSVIDLYDNEMPIGTKVIVTLPFRVFK